MSRFELLRGPDAKAQRTLDRADMVYLDTHELPYDRITEFVLIIAIRAAVEGDWDWPTLLAEINKHGLGIPADARLVGIHAELQTEMVDIAASVIQEYLRAPQRGRVRGEWPDELLISGDAHVVAFCFFWDWPDGYQPECSALEERWRAEEEGRGSRGA